MKLPCFVLIAVLFVLAPLVAAGQSSNLEQDQQIQEATAAANAPDWFLKLRQLTVRVSSASNLTRIFKVLKVTDRVQHSGVEMVWYSMPDGILVVEYSAGNCPLDRAAKCGFPRGAILSIRFRPNLAMKISNFGVNLRNLERYTENDNPTEHFVDIQAGINFAVQRKKVVSFLIFHPDDYEQVRRIDITGNP